MSKGLIVGRHCRGDQSRFSIHESMYRDSALRALSTLRGLRGAPEVPPLCRETQSLGHQMLNAPFSINGLTKQNPVCFISRNILSVSNQINMNLKINKTQLSECTDQPDRKLTSLDIMGLQLKPPSRPMKSSKRKFMIV